MGSEMCIRDSQCSAQVGLMDYYLLLQDRMMHRLVGHLVVVAAALLTVKIASSSRRYSGVIALCVMVLVRRVFVLRLACRAVSKRQSCWKSAPMSPSRSALVVTFSSHSDYLVLARSDHLIAALARWANPED